MMSNVVQEKMEKCVYCTLVVDRSGLNIVTDNNQFLVRLMLQNIRVDEMSVKHDDMWIFTLFHVV